MALIYTNDCNHQKLYVHQNTNHIYLHYALSIFAIFQDKFSRTSTMDDTRAIDISGDQQNSRAKSTFHM